MPSLWFVVPAAGRVELARICLRQLRRTCDQLAANGIDASAVVIADDANLDTAAELGFATVRRDNRFLSRKFNDGIQLACDPRVNPRPADYVVPCGSDDWIDHRILLRLPQTNHVVLAFRRAAFVDETGRRLISREVDYHGGVGIRVYPAKMMARTRLLGRDENGQELWSTPYRPADEDRARGCDTSILVNLTRTYRGSGPRIVYGDRHDFQIVDWKSRSKQLNTFEAISNRFRRGSQPLDPFQTLRTVFPAEALDEMRAHYGVGALVAA